MDFNVKEFFGLILLTFGLIVSVGAAVGVSLWILKTIL
jgi:hypothetical protein|nr:MAG TPA: TMEM213 family [Caudoviricetes sp.]